MNYPQIVQETLSDASAGLSEICRRYHIRRLSLFGSVLRGDARPESDLDLLVEFEPGHVPGFAFVTIQSELSQLLGRKVDLNTYGSLSRYFRDEVLAHAEVIYASYLPALIPSLEHMIHDEGL